MGGQRSASDRALVQQRIPCGGILTHSVDLEEGKAATVLRLGVGRSAVGRRTVADKEPVTGVLDAVVESTEQGDSILVAGIGIEGCTSELTRRGYQVHGLVCDRTALEGSCAVLGEGQIDGGRTFDCVLSLNCLAASGGPEIVVGDWNRLLGPSGRLILVEAQDGAAARNSGATIWSPEAVRKLVEAAGFRVDAVSVDHGVHSILIVTVVKPTLYFEVGGYRFVSAETAEDVEKVWRLRYEVYCEELGVEPENRSGIMTDEFDDYSMQLLAVDGSNQAVGTLRVVSDGPKGLPIEADYPLREYMEAHGISKAAEGGRFAIGTGVPRESRGMVAFGLFKLLVDYCRRSGTNDIFHTTHLRIYEKYEMPGFTQIGEPFEYPGALAGIQWVPMHCDIGRIGGPALDEYRLRSIDR